MKQPSSAVVATIILLATTACGGSPDTAAATDQQSAGVGTQRDSQQDSDGGVLHLPGATGEIAAIDGKTLQVQNPMSGQVAVTYSRATTFTEQVKAKASDLQVGDCVMVGGDGDDTLVATSVRITPAADGSCTPAMRSGPGGGGPRGQQGERPRGVPTDLPSGAPSRVTMGAFGRVTAVSKAGFTVESAAVPGQSSASTRRVTTTSATTWTDTVAANADALKVGKCVVAEGAKDDSGAVTAKTLAVSGKVGGQCGMGLRRVEAAQP
jgi:hypothetical protein